MSDSNNPLLPQLDGIQTRERSTHRRIDDLESYLLLASHRCTEPEREVTFSIHAGLEAGGDRARIELSQRPAGWHELQNAVVLDVGSEEAVLLVGAGVRRLPRGSGGDDLVHRAASGAVAWRREQIRAGKRVRRADQMVAFVDRLCEAEDAMGVYRALMEFTTRIVCGYTSAVLVGDGNEGWMHPVDGKALGCDALVLGLPYHPRFSRPGLLTWEDVNPDTGAPFAMLSPLFTEGRIVAIAHHPIGHNGVLWLLERRRERIFEPEDWDLLGTLTHLADGTQDRIRRLAEAQQLSLTDPLTGLANRRHLKIVLEHSLGAARRGEPLTLIMLDLDGFKEINDRHGHLQGDATLRLFADSLREQARGSDFVTRYGGDEFLVVLSGDAGGARVFLRRIEERLAGQVRFSPGIAEYHVEIQSAEELIEMADRDLLRFRREQEGRTASVMGHAAEAGEAEASPPTVGGDDIVTRFDAEHGSPARKEPDPPVVDGPEAV